MQKDISYHQSAIQYNEELADFAEDLSKRLENAEVAKWAQSVSKQHRFHAGRHKKSLANIEDGNVPGVETNNEKTVYRNASTGEYVTEEYAKEHPDITISEKVPDVHPKFQRPKKQ
jgi:hypothetical protein